MFGKINSDYIKHNLNKANKFIGHHYEKAKPAFVDDLSQFLIGPLFLMAEVYFMLGLESVLKARVTSLALEKRKALEKKNRSK